MNKRSKLAIIALCSVILVLFGGCSKSVITTTTTTVSLTAAQIIVQASDKLDAVNSFIAPWTNRRRYSYRKWRWDDESWRRHCKTDKLQATLTGTVSGMSVTIKWYPSAQSPTWPTFIQLLEQLPTELPFWVCLIRIPDHCHYEGHHRSYQTQWCAVGRCWLLSLIR